MENPFIVTGRIKPEYFCDRVKESDRLVRSIMSGGENVVIISPRRLGKTGLINFCFEKPEVKDKVTTIMVDILRTSTLQEFTYLLGRAVFKTLGSRSQQMMKTIVDTLLSLRGSFGYDPIKNTPTFDIKLGDITNPAHTLEEIFDCLEKADRHCVVAIDEFSRLSITLTRTWKPCCAPTSSSRPMPVSSLPAASAISWTRCFSTLTARSIRVPLS